MNTLIILIFGVPILEVYILIKIGSQIGVLNTISLILITAIVGIAYARHEGFNTLKSGISQLKKDELPIYEIISGATLTFAAILLILPGFVTDILGIFLIFPYTRKLFIKRFLMLFKFPEEKPVIIFSYAILAPFINSALAFSSKFFSFIFLSSFFNGNSWGKFDDIFLSKVDFFPKIPLNLKKINPAIIAKSIISMYSKL